jgi:hypothetical protein
MALALGYYVSALQAENRPYWAKYNKMQSTTIQTDLTPELYGVEAALATATPQMDAAVRDRMKAVALLETCRRTQPELPNLVKTIVDAGEQGITVSLRRYVKMERFQAMVLGIVFGLIVGAIVNLVGLTVILQYLR